MSRSVMGGAIHPIKIVTDAELTAGTFTLSGRTAVPIHGFTAVGERTLGNEVQPVYVVSQAQVNNGDFRVGGGAAVPMANVAVVGGAGRAVNGRLAQPVFVVGGALA